MESAVYLAATNKIYGVRGQWIYECDPATGSVQRSGRFTDNVLFGASITALGSKVYVAVSYTDRWNYQNPMPGCDIYGIDPTALPFPTATPFGFDLSKLGGSTSPFPLYPGWSCITAEGSKLYGFSSEEGVFSVDPTNLPSYFRFSQEDAVGLAIDPSVHTGFAAIPFIWLTDSIDSFGGNIYIYASDHSDSSNVGSGVGSALGGITLCNSTMKVYAVKGTEDFIKVDANAPFVAPPFLSNFAVSTLHTAPVVGVLNPQPSRIRACNVIGNPYFGKVLIPTMKGDQVIVWDSASDLPANAVVKTGFSAPYDICFTPTGALAVQNSSAGLKPIT